MAHTQFEWDNEMHDQFAQLAKHEHPKTFKAAKMLIDDGRLPNIHCLLVGEGLHDLSFAALVLLIRWDVVAKEASS